MLGISRWTEKGGSYRTVQRFFYTVIPWATVFWLFFREYLLEPSATSILAGDESIVTKAGKKTYGLDRFFSSLYGKPEAPGIIISFIGGLGGRDISAEEFYEMVSITRKAIASGDTPKPRLLYTDTELREVRKLQAIAMVEREETYPSAQRAGPSASQETSSE